MREKKVVLPVLDINEVDKRFQNLNQHAKILHDRLVQLGMVYINFTISKSILKEPLFNLRNSIIYRYNSILFHLKLLIIIHNNHVKQINYNKSDNQIKLIMLNGRERELSIFDSIIFHIISLFDYIGNLLDYVCCGKKQMRLKWNGVVKKARNQNDIITQYSVSETILKYDKELIDKLYKYRSNIIHYKMHLGSVTSSLDFKTGKQDNNSFCSFKIHKKYQ